MFCPLLCCLCPSPSCSFSCSFLLLFKNVVSGVESFAPKKSSRQKKFDAAAAIYLPAAYKGTDGPTAATGLRIRLVYEYNAMTEICCEALGTSAPPHRTPSAIRRTKHIMVRGPLDAPDGPRLNRGSPSPSVIHRALPRHLGQARAGAGRGAAGGRPGRAGSARVGPRDVAAAVHGQRVVRAVLGLPERRRQQAPPLLAHGGVPGGPRDRAPAAVAQRTLLPDLVYMAQHCLTRARSGHGGWGTRQGGPGTACCGLRDLPTPALTNPPLPCSVTGFGRLLEPVRLHMGAGPIHVQRQRL